MITAIDKNTALVLIDLQKGIANTETAPHSVKDVLANAAKLVTAFRKANLPIVIVHVNPIGAAWLHARVDAPNPMAKGQLPPHFDEIVSEIETRDEDIRILKRSWNAFFHTSLHDELQAKKITQIVLAGISTSIGVEGTARDASPLGYNIAFATDAMTDRLAAAHEHSIKNIFPRIGELGTTDEIIGFLPAAK